MEKDIKYSGHPSPYTVKIIPLRHVSPCYGILCLLAGYNLLGGHGRKGGYF